MPGNHELAHGSGAARHRLRGDAANNRVAIRIDRYPEPGPRCPPGPAVFRSCPASEQMDWDESFAGPVGARCGVCEVVAVDTAFARTSDKPGCSTIWTVGVSADIFCGELIWSLAGMSFDAIDFGWH